MLWCLFCFASALVLPLPPPRADLFAARVDDEPEYVRMIEQLLWPGRSHWPLQKSWDVDVSRLLFPSVAGQQG